MTHTETKFELCVIHDTGAEDWITVEGPDAKTNAEMIQQALWAIGRTPLIYQLDTTRTQRDSRAPASARIYR